MLFVTGDIHGDYDSLNKRNLRQIKRGDKLLVTGDFGFIWDNSKNELKNFVKLTRKKFDVLFVEGAHENFELLSKYPEADLYMGKGYKLAHNIYCLKRGEIYTIDGRTVFALGGGLAPYEESTGEETPSMPTDEQLKYAVDNLQKHRKRVDLIITHEAPASVKKLIDKNAEINDLNIFLDTVMHNTSYGAWYFGSLHEDRRVSDKLTCVFDEVHRVS